MVLLVNIYGRCPSCITKLVGSKQGCYCITIEGCNLKLCVGIGLGASSHVGGGGGIILGPLACIGIEYNY